MTKSIAIFGGAGFLGSQVSKAALAKGWQVTSISRSGQPTRTEDWHAHVKWIKGDVFNPATYRDSLSSADHVITTIGVLDYRGFMKPGSPAKIIDRFGSTLHDSFKELLSSPQSSQSAKELSRYDTMNFEAAKAIADESVHHPRVQSFLYVSAAGGFPGIPQKYITTKRKAENYIQSLQGSSFRSIFFRPGFMFSSETQPGKKAVARVLGLTYALTSAVPKLELLMGAAGVKPLAVERVGAAVIEACEDERISGPIETFQIEALADVRWRAEMIV